MAETTSKGTGTPDRTLGHLSLQSVSKRFAGSTVLALENITLTCAPGEFVVVVGPSGCGKSTLLNIVAGMTSTDSGSAEIDGRPIVAPGPDRAMVFQDHGLFPWLTAAKNVEFGLKMAGVPRDERRDRAHEALRMVNLAKASEKLPHQLSGGMRQRVAIARALVVDPAVLLMDEPFAALDAQTRTLLHAQLQEIWARTKKTILFVTHSVGEAVRLADRIIVLNAHPGRIRREVAVPLRHPRPAESAELAAIGHIIRTEIQHEVDRVNAEVEARL